MMRAPRRRPTGVTIVATLLAIQVAIGLIIGIITVILTLSGSHALVAHGHTAVATTLNILGIGLGGFLIVASLIELFFIWGLWTLQRWAFWATVIILALTLISRVSALLQPDYDLVRVIAGMIIPVFILLYFVVDPDVRSAFRIGSRS